MRRLRVLGLATVLTVGGGTGFLVAGLTGGSAGADSTLGGFTVSGLAEGATAQYEQPNFPLPSTPSLEVDDGYAATSDNFGPTGSAVASTLYPGQVVANAGPELSLLVPGVPLPPAPTWPLEAVSNFPQTPNTTSTDEPGVSMDAISNADGNTATATLGDDAPSAGSAGNQATGSTGAGGGNPLAASSAIAGIGLISATSSSTTTDTVATASATSTVSGISLLDGFVTIGGVTSTATATSDGTKGSVTGSTVLTNVSIAGEAVSVTSTGITALGKTSLLSVPVATLNKLLSELGITLAINQTTDAIDGPAAARTLDGLKISINLDTLDNAANKFASLLPAALTSKLPVAIPDMQLLSLDLATVSVSATASPAFADDGSSDSGSTDGGSGDTSTGSFGGDGTTSGSFDGGGSLGTGGTTGALGTTPTTGGAGGTGGSGLSLAPTAATTPAFAGIGAGLILLGVLAALALAYTYKRVEDTTELLGSGCAEGDPLNDLFKDTGDSTFMTGGFGE
jgi:hypothetical protein